MKHHIQKKNNTLLSLLGRAVCFVLAVGFVTSCQTKDPQLSVTTAEYKYVPFYNANLSQSSALMMDEKIPEGQQVIAMPPQKPTAHFLTAPEIKQDPSVLVGYNIEMAKGFFGPESNVRKDKYSQTLQYYHQSCAVDIFLYDETEGAGKYVVEYVDLRLQKGVSRDKCMDEALTKLAMPFEQYIARN